MNLVTLTNLRRNFSFYLAYFLCLKICPFSKLQMAKFVFFKFYGPGNPAAFER